MKDIYCDIIHSVEHIYHLFYDILKKILPRLEMDDINPTQAMLIYNIGDQKVSAGDLTVRRMYYGSNVSYNLKKLLSAGYLVSSASAHDKRALYVELSEKGRSAYAKLSEALGQQADGMKALFPNRKTLDAIYKGIHSLEISLSQNHMWG